MIAKMLKDIYIFLSKYILHLNKWKKQK